MTRAGGVLDRWRRLWRRGEQSALVPYETPTYLRHGVVVPALPSRDDDGYGWPEGYLSAHAEADARHASLMAAARKRSTQLANDIAEAAHVRALDELRRAHEVLRAQHQLQRTRRLIHAIDLDPPTGPIEIPRDAMARSAAGGDEEEPAADAPAPAGWPTELPAQGTALERAERFVRWCLDQGAPVPSVGELNRAVGTSNYVRGAHITQWRDAWNAGL